MSGGCIHKAKQNALTPIVKKGDCYVAVCGLPGEFQSGIFKSRLFIYLLTQMCINITTQYRGPIMQSLCPTLQTIVCAR